MRMGDVGEHNRPGSAPRIAVEESQVGESLGRQWLGFPLASGGPRKEPRRSQCLSKCAGSAKAKSVFSALYL